MTASKQPDKPVSGSGPWSDCGLTDPYCKQQGHCIGHTLGVKKQPEQYPYHHDKLGKSKDGVNWISDQEALIDLVADPKTIEKVVEGSMDKRLKVLEQPEQCICGYNPGTGYRMDVVCPVHDNVRLGAKPSVGFPSVQPEPYVCPQCGIDIRGADQHAWYAHTFDGLYGKPYPEEQPEPSLREKIEKIGNDFGVRFKYLADGALAPISFPDAIMQLFADDKAQAVAEARIGKVQDKNFHRMVKAMGDRLYELATIPKMPRAQFDKEIVPMAADIYALGFRDINDLINTAQKKLLDDIYALSPTKNFEHWKPQDALQFYERLKGLESRLTEGGKS